MTESLNLLELTKSFLSMFLGNLEGGCNMECVKRAEPRALLLPLPPLPIPPVWTIGDEEVKYMSLCGGGEEEEGGGYEVK